MQMLSCFLQSGVVMMVRARRRRFEQVQSRQDKIRTIRKIKFRLFWFGRFLFGFLFIFGRRGVRGRLRGGIDRRLNRYWSRLFIGNVPEEIGGPGGLCQIIDISGFEQFAENSREENRHMIQTNADIGPDKTRSVHNVDKVFGDDPHETTQTEDGENKGERGNNRGCERNVERRNQASQI